MEKVSAAFASTEKANSEKLQQYEQANGWN